MAVVWQHDAITVREVFEQLNAQAPRQRAYTTFMTVMRRLAAKGVLERRREGKTDVYCASMTEEEYAAARARGSRCASRRVRRPRARTFRRRDARARSRAACRARAAGKR